MTKQSLIAAHPWMKCGNATEFKQRLQWLSEGMLRNHMEGIIDYTPNQYEIETYNRYIKES